VLYSANEFGGKMHINMVDSLSPVKRFSLAPDSPMVLANSRHPITEAGFDTIVGNIEQSLAMSKAGDPAGGKLTYGGLEQPEGLDHPCHKIVRVTPSGETWLVYLDPQSKLPALVQANAANGDLLERYLFRDPHTNVPELAQADAFDPNKRWGAPKGFLSRLARQADPDAKADAPTTTR
jgi:hypothetical protein